MPARKGPAVASGAAAGAHPSGGRVDKRAARAVKAERGRRKPKEADGGGGVEVLDAESAEAAAAAPAGGGKPRPLIVAVDPGVCNMGVFVVDPNVSDPSHCAVDFARIGLVKSNKAPVSEVLDALRASICRGGELNRLLTGGPGDSRERVVYVEDQRHAVNQNQMAMQHAIQFIVGSSRCRTITPASVKLMLPNVFKGGSKSRKETAGDDTSSKSKRRYWNKRNAVLAAERVLSYSITSRVASAAPKKKDDVYDAFWICVAAAMRDWGVRYPRTFLAGPPT